MEKTTYAIVLNGKDNTVRIEQFHNFRLAFKIITALNANHPDACDLAIVGLSYDPIDTIGTPEEWLAFLDKKLFYLHMIDYWTADDKKNIAEVHRCMDIVRRYMER